MNPDAIYNTLAHGSAEDRVALLQQLPPDDLKATIAPLLASGTPGMPVVTLGMLVMKYCNGQDPELGAVLGQALHRYGVEVFESGRDPGLLLFTLSGLAFQYVNACNLLGRSEEVIRFAKEWIPYYEARGESKNLPSLKVARIAALLNRNQIDAAEEALRDPALRGNFAANIEIARLEKKVRDLKRTITTVRGAESAVAGGSFGSDKADDAIERALREVVGAAFDNQTQEESVAKVLVERLAAAPPADPSDPEAFKKLLETLRVGESFLTHGSSEDSQWTIKRRIREATGIFVLSKTPSAESLKASLAELEPCLAWSREHGDLELANDALWGMYLCHNRLHDPSRAADALLDLRVNLEARREGISDPLARGGVFADYPYLFDALCEKLHQSGRIPDLLEAIEAAKGRGIADILTKKAGRPIADADIYAAARNVRNLVVKHRFHYLTFHVDDERTYAVLVTKQGELHSPEPVPLGRQAIRATALHADPRDWGQPLDENPSIRIANASNVLGGLVAWLHPLVDAGEIEAHDHVCYVADEDLANVPLQYLRFGDGTLADHLSVSKIHGAFHLDLLLKDEAPVRPKAFLGVVVPTKQNISQHAWPAMRQAMWRPVEWLRARMAGETVADTEADIAGFSALPLQQRIVHLSTHGIFPEARSPFENSGIVLAEAAALPDETTVATAADLGAVLTPSKVLETRMDLHGSHVSLMSCVSGLSREGRGGDALGLEWALIQAGATSVLASHWYVSARLAAEFFEHFYQHWLTDGMSRAAAHAQTIRDVRQSRGDEATDAWAAFSLVGDWR